MKKFPLAQTHLDFHTSPDIEEIGSKFSKENFQAALKHGNLDSITVFAKCHHGVCYYPTKVGTMHPHLDFDLTGAMVEAAHEIGVRAPIYITAGWSHLDAKQHPEWIAVRKDGTWQTSQGYDATKAYNQPRENCSWQTLCLNDNDYCKHIYEITEEVCKRYKELDGLFYDICTNGNACYCESCMKGMREMGYDPQNDDDARKYYMVKRCTFMKKCNDIMKKYHPDATIFFNGGAHLEKSEFYDYQSHFELEDLPTAWGGYDKLPIRAKFFKSTGKPTLGMTGKFHLDWGEFGGFKSKDALKFEVATMALYGVGASIGDHMHPDGEMELQTYENIGYAYDYVKKIAPFCFDGEHVSNIGVYITQNWGANEGISNILLENQMDYDIVVNDNFEKFDTVIIPAATQMDDESLVKLKKYLDNGGKLVLMSDALVKDGEFQIDTGLKYVGPAEYDCDYIVPTQAFDDVPNAPMLVNLPGHRTENIDAKVYAEIMTPYFNRTYAHYCGHKNTPHNKNSKRFPAIAKKGNVVYLAHSLARQYFEYGSLFTKRYVINALNLVYGGAILKAEGLGSQGRCTMVSQPDKRRFCINMIYASPIRRGKAEIIEDIMPVYNIRLTLRTSEKIKNIYIGLTGENIDFTQKGDEISFVVPELCCHTSVVVEY